MEVIYNQNDNQLRSRQRKTAQKKGGLGGEAEIGEGLWATGRLFLPLASGWSSLSNGSVAEGLCDEPDLEKVETADADVPRSQLIPGVRDFKKGTGEDNDEAHGDNDDRWCTETSLFFCVAPILTGMNVVSQWPVTKMEIKC